MAWLPGAPLLALTMMKKEMAYLRQIIEAQMKLMALHTGSQTRTMLSQALRNIPLQARLQI
jgi:type IV secretory pathway ATPase VirB11/archaellum biosynthesis ATPase